MSSSIEYKTILISPDGIRVKGDDHSKELAKIIEKEVNLLAGEGWTLNSVLPSHVSDGSVVKILVIMQRDLLPTAK